MRRRYLRIFLFLFNFAKEQSRFLKSSLISNILANEKTSSALIMPGGRRKRGGDATNRNKKARTEEAVEVVQLAGHGGQAGDGGADFSSPSTSAAQGKKNASVPTQHSPSLADFVDFDKVLADSDISLQTQTGIDPEVAQKTNRPPEILKFTGREET